MLGGCKMKKSKKYEEFKLDNDPVECKGCWVESLYYGGSLVYVKDDPIDYGDWKRDKD